MTTLMGKAFRKLEDTPDANLPDLLKQFYMNACQKKNNELYCTQTMKNITLKPPNSFTHDKL